MSLAAGLYKLHVYVSSVGNPWRAGVGIGIRYSYEGLVRKALED